MVFRAILATLIVATSLPAVADQAAEREQMLRDLIQEADDSMRGTRPESRIRMKVQTKNWTREYEILSYEKSREVGMTRILAPKRDRGTSFLKTDGTLWMYSPSVRRTIPIPAAMMGNSFMGSDLSYDDMTNESDILEDFDFKWVKDEPCPINVAKTCAVIDLFPNDNATVPYGKQRTWITLDTRIYEKTDMYDEDMIAVKTMLFEDIRKLDGRDVAHKWTVKNLIETDRVTEIFLDSIQFNNTRPDRDFSKAALSEFTR